MTGQEIRQALDKQYQLQEKLLESNNFVLQTAMFEIRKEILRLQAQCPHSFEKGYCIYCNKKEE